MNSGEEKQLAVIKPYLGDIQAFIDERIFGTVTMTGIKIAEGFITKKWDQPIGTAPITVNNFVKGFRLALREGLITGLEPAQSRGYKRVGVVIPKTMIISPEDWGTICSRLQLEPSAGLSEVLKKLEIVQAILPSYLISSV